jgi:hypothetical protein
MIKNPIKCSYNEHFTGYIAFHFKHWQTSCSVRNVLCPFHVKVNVFCPQFYFLNSFIHMCIHCLGHFSPATPCPLPLPPTSPRFQVEPVLPFSPILLKTGHKQQERQSVFASWDKDSYTERFLALLPCVSVLQPKLIHLYLTFSLVPNPFPILTSVALRFLY